MALVRRFGGGAKGGAGAAASTEGDIASEFPELVEWLSALVWAEGEDRQTGTMMVFCEDGKWKAWLNDRDAGLSAFVTAATLDALLNAACNALCAEGGDWRPTKRPPGKRS
jgi:hypothetical protein